MYFNDRKEDTNIDDEFSKDSNESYGKLKKIIIIIAIAFVAILLIAFIISKLSKKTNYYLELEGEDVITVFQGVNYITTGTFHAWSDENADLSSEVVINSNLDTSQVGEYKITYTLYDISLTRTIKVIAKTGELIKINLKGDSPLTVHVGDRFVDPGVSSVVDYTGESIPISRVKVTIKDSATQELVSSVNTSKEGYYRITYSVSNSKGDSTKEERVVRVIAAK